MRKLSMSYSVGDGGYEAIGFGEQKYGLLPVQTVEYPDDTFSV